MHEKKTHGIEECKPKNDKDCQQTTKAEKRHNKDFHSPQKVAAQ